MTTTTTERPPAPTGLTVVDPLAGLDFVADVPCDWCPDIAQQDPPHPATWLTTTAALPCGHVGTTWTVCGHCLSIVIRARHGGHKKYVAHCTGRVPLAAWLLTYTPIEQPSWAQAGTG